MTDTAEFEKMERSGWSDPAIAKGYADAFQEATRAVAIELSNAVRAKPGTRVLDLCTGHGVVAAQLLRHGALVSGLDFSPAMIALARKAAPEATFYQGDAMNMSVDDDSFDAVTIGFGVPHFPDPERGLAEAARVLKPGGRIAFSIWQGKGSDGAFGWLFDAVGRLGDPSVTLPAGPDAHMLADRTIAEPMMSALGFADIDVTELPTELELEIPEALFDAFDRGAVRAASLLGGQSQAIRDAIRADLASRVRSEGTEANGRFRVRSPSVMTSATLP